MRLYKVEFKFTKGYSEPKMEGVASLVIVVSAANQFSALTVAWQNLASLNLPEPASFNAVQLGSDC
jgi:hypothetical protein